MPLAPTSRIGRARRLAAMAMVAALASGAQQGRPAPNFEGKSIPDPPAQVKPWTPPATTLPKFLLDATAALLEQGVADPRGCEYRRVEIAHGQAISPRGFVLPERADVPGRFVIAWDGLIYPALSVGEPADLDLEVRELAASLKANREASKAVQQNFAGGWGFPLDTGNPLFLSGVNDHSPIKLCLLLRLGRGDLTESLFAANTPWTPGPRRLDLTDYGVSYLSLAQAWAGSAFDRLVRAHVRGDDVIALDLARRLVRFRDLARASATAMGFPGANMKRPTDRFGDPTPWFADLGQLDDLLRDHERRAAMPPRPPVPKRAGDPSARVAALIRDLDQFNERLPFGFDPFTHGQAPAIKNLIAEGDAIIGPLLRALESDDRLTRSVERTNRGFGGEARGLVMPVFEVAYVALDGLLETDEFHNRRPIAGEKSADPAARRDLAVAMLQFWERHRSVPLEVP